MDFSLVIAASAAVNRFVEFIKPYVRKLQYTVDIQDGLLVLIAVLAGVAVAFMGNLNLFVGIPNLPVVFAQILTGVIAGLGADVINVVIDLLYGWKANVESKSAKVG
jgi:hypothetical protein